MTAPLPSRSRFPILTTKKPRQRASARRSAAIQWLNRAETGLLNFSAAQERNEKQHEKEYKEYLGDRRGGAGDDAEAEHAGKNGDNKKDDSVV